MLDDTIGLLKVTKEYTSVLQDLSQLETLKTLALTKEGGNHQEVEIVENVMC